MEEDEKQNKVKADSRTLLFNLQEKKTNRQNVDSPNMYRAHKIENTNNSRENEAKEMELTEKEMQMLLPCRKKDIQPNVYLKVNTVCYLKKIHC